MSESVVGLRVAATRQNAGSALNARALPPPPGGVKAPAATSTASLIEPSRIANEASCSHGVPAAWGWVANTAASIAAVRQPLRILMAVRITPVVLSRAGKPRGPG